jgi:hypothetical protein
MKVKVINTQRQDRVAKSRKEDSISYIYLEPSFWSLDLFSWGRSISVDVAASCSPAISPCLVSYSCVGIDELVVTPASVQLSYYKSKLLHHCLPFSYSPHPRLPRNHLCHLQQSFIITHSVRITLFGCDKSIPLGLPTIHHFGCSSADSDLSLLLLPRL